MILNKLPPQIEQQIFNLIKDAQFQKRFAEDKTLDYLQEQKHDKSIEFQQLLLLIYKKNIIGGIAFKPITFALYSYLYCLRSNIVFDMASITKEDLDIFFYLLQTRNYTSDINSLMKASYDYGKKQYGLSYNEMVYVFNKLYKIEWKVFSLFPKEADNGESPVFDVSWIINKISRVKPLTSYTTEELYSKVSVSQIYHYYAQYLKIRGSDSIFFRSDQEILDEMDSRMIDMVLERLIQKNIVKKQDRKKYFDLMKESKEKE